MIEVRGSEERYRGGDTEVGIETRHAFSFGHHYDPDNLRFGALIACNEEALAAHAGFEEHPHRDTEIVTWVVEGALTHRDSAGNVTVVRPGDIQRLSSARGVRHVERNDADVPLRFVQMWLAPTSFGGEPSYEVVRALPDDAPYAVPRAGATLRVWRPKPGDRTALPAAARVYVHVVRGTVTLGDARLTAGDAARLADESGAGLIASEAAECLIWAMDAEPVYGGEGSGGPEGLLPEGTS
ncbi:pirin family protein [Streptomyces sp. NPDC003077]|uniref:pirin family protein n=1 Tax=Streptomyces sp. NPDC003077 TaxID=3154443 RepID=UPI0033A547AF